MMVSTFEELRKQAVNWWPAEIVKEVAASSPSVLLEKTHEEFCQALVTLPDSPNEIRGKLKDLRMAQNLFLKHLVVLADVGGERIQRLSSEKASVFSTSRSGGFLSVSVGGKHFDITIDRFMTERRVDNKKLFLDGDGLQNQIVNSRLIEDMSLIILFGAFSINEDAAEVLSRCDLFKFVGDIDLLESTLRRRYIEVSRVVTGGTANSQGQILQRQVASRLRSKLGSDYSIEPSVQQEISGRKHTSDILIRRGGRSVAIEVSFQETTNSTIERKANSAAARRADLNSISTASCYVIDGAGNFRRESAVRKIIADSDLVVNFSDDSTDSLVAFIRNWLRDDSLR